MANKAVFLDRDNTVTEDPGYLSSPDQVKLRPGVELALKSLSQAGYKLVVVTNQSGIARGLLTVEQLEAIHAELRRQLAEKGAHLDAVFYCPYHPEGTVVEYAKDSDLRKPEPGMLLKAAAQMDIDLSKSWMVGDSPRDMEAGQRAGCRTVRVRTPGETHHPAVEGTLEDVQADLTVRNVVEAAREILRHDSQADAAAAEPAESQAPPPLPLEEPVAAPSAAAAEQTEPHNDKNDSQVRREILSYVRQLVRAEEHEEFSITKLLAGIIQMVAILALFVTAWKMIAGGATATASLWAQVAMTLQVMALTFFMMQRGK